MNQTQTVTRTRTLEQSAPSTSPLLDKVANGHVVTDLDKSIAVSEQPVELEYYEHETCYPDQIFRRKKLVGGGFGPWYVAVKSAVKQVWKRYIKE